MNVAPINAAPPPTSPHFNPAVIRNAAPEVQRAATFVTASNAEDGFALAIERFVLGTDVA